jgi:hypothetical protein
MNAGNRRLDVFNETRDEGDVLAAYDIAYSLHLHPLALSTAYAPSLDSFLERLHSNFRLCIESGQTARLPALEYSVNISRLSVRFCPIEKDTRIGFLEARALGLEQLFEEYAQSAPDMIMEAIVFWRRLLKLGNSDDERGERRNHLASLLWKYWKRSGKTDMNILREEIDLRREILETHDVSDSERAKACSSLAISLDALFKSVGDLTLQDEVLELEREVLRLRPEGHSHRVRACGNLAITLWRRFKQTGETALLDETLNLEREVLRLRPKGHPDRAASCSNLAVSLRTRFKQCCTRPSNLTGK